MSLVTWLTQKLILGDGPESLSAEVLFNTYKIDSALERQQDINYLTFCQILQKVFKVESKRKVCNKRKQTVYSLQWKSSEENATDSKAFDAVKISTILNESSVHCHVQICENNVKVDIPTSYVANGNVVNKSVNFKGDLTFDVVIREQVIDLNAIHISPIYRPSHQGILEVLQQVSTIQLCQGIPVKNKNYKPHSNILHETISEEGEENRSILRSRLCKQNALFNSRKIPNCTTCQRLTVNVQETATAPSVIDTLKSLMPTATEATITFLAAQVTNSQKQCNNQNRWDTTTINECLNLFTRSPEGYKSLRQSGLLILPSPSLLLLYKNTIQQKPGFHQDIFRWMFEEAERMGIAQEGRVGGVLIDEMSIQEKLEIVRKGDSLRMVGFVDQGAECEALNSLKAGSSNKELGTHILQMMFMGVSGFRFPFAHFISNTLSASHLYVLFWEAVNLLQDLGFTVKYVCMDGAVNNRSFMHIHFPDKQPTAHKMTSKCPTNPSQQMIFLMDPKHTFKKIRNNVLKSGNTTNHTRLLILPSGITIQWSMWVNAYKWDCQNPVQIHYKLTNEHLYPSNTSKMRNKLAEDVLDSEMLNLMLAYQDSLGDKGRDLNGAVEFLQQTSILINLFRDKRPVHLPEDDRLQELSAISMWFNEWQTSSPISKSRKGSEIMSVQCMEDVQSTIVGFLQLCNTIISENNHSSVIPAMINSDPIENHFCQQRGKFNGLNTNPTALQYQRNANGIILGQSAISRKSNTGGVSSNCQNFKNATKGSASSEKKRARDQTETAQPIKVTKMGKK